MPNKNLIIIKNVQLKFKKPCMVDGHRQRSRKTSIEIEYSITSYVMPITPFKKVILFHFIASHIMLENRKVLIS